MKETLRTTIHRIYGRALPCLLCFLLLPLSSFAQDPVVAEAESGTLTGTVVATERTGFSGTGYVTSFDNDGDKVTVTVSAPAAGNYTLDIRYASPYDVKTNDVYINGSLVANHVFPKTEVFTTTRVGTVSLQQGNNTIAVVKNWGYFEVDNFTITGSGSADNNPPVAQAGPAQLIKMDTDGNGLETFSLDAAASTDPEDNIASYEWKYADGTVAGTEQTLELALAVGGYELILTVTDAKGLSAQDRIKLFVGDPTNGGNNRVPLRNGRELVFVSGVNLAWKDYSRDVVALDEAYFEQVLNNIESAGGNALRWWLHTNGRYSPDFGADGRVTGLNPNTIPMMRKVLDMAYERGIVISMCLFSFDLLQPQGQDQAMMKKLVEDKAITQTYIDNALLPILNEIGTHPAVMAWEVFNEPEGMTQEFGWTPVKTQMKYVQQFVNLVAGAIHRKAPEALVSNGSWSFKVLTDKEGNTNYYSDERLIAAGGDPEGTLDFYQVHFYPEHFDNSLSPFHRPASWWGLDKPIVIAEYPIGIVEGRVDPAIDITETFKLAYDYGYAGALPWEYKNFNGYTFEAAKPGIAYLKEHYPEAVTISTDPDYNRSPRVVAAIPAANILQGTTTRLENYIDLKTIFTDPEDGSNLSYTIEANTNAALAQPEISAAGILSISLSEGATGEALISVRATDAQGAGSSVSFAVNVREPNNNLALFRSVTASSFEFSGNNPLNPEHATDGLMDTRWSSAYADDQWISIDLGAQKAFDRVILHWEAAYGKAYELQVSEDGQRWTTVHTKINGTGGTEEVSFPSVEARYVRMLGKTRATEWGFSLWEFEVYNSAPTGIDTSSQYYKDFQLFPNPAKGRLRVKLPAVTGQQLQIYNASGSLLHSQQVQGLEIELDVSRWSPGQYLLKLQSARGVVTRKLIVQ
jgi:hypothetical protein